MYEKENNMKNITQSVFSEQLPSTEVQILAVLGLYLWKVKTDIDLQAENTQELPSLPGPAKPLFINKHPYSARSVNFQGLKEQGELKPSFLDQMAVFTSLYLMFIF